MADSAFKQHVGRDSFHPGDLAVAGGAFGGCLRWYRVVGIVTGDARLQGVVSHGVDLWEAGGPREIIGVALGTKLAFPRGRRLIFIRILGMGYRSTVAALAGKIAVIACLLQIIDIIVALGTGAGADETDLLGQFPFNCRSPLGTHLLQSRRDNERPNEQHRPEEKPKNHYQPDKGIGDFA
jgi:hypothetical protein